ncbi:MAG TPA: uroporphyrinogen-III synthase [Candidatus Dormibacteraeota bacterium]|nr:uroporphyrinogen-III synthase [Candidatus Dormibacteraeota bacterium]
MASGAPTVALLCTRPDGERDPLVGRLHDAGYAVHAVPTVATEALPFDPPDLARFDWVVVTSATGVSALLDSVAPVTAAPIRWAAVGPRTVAALAQRAVTAAAVPEQPHGVQIAAAVARVQPLGGLRVLLARADAAAPDLPAALREAGADVTDLAVYHTVVGPEPSRPGIAAALADPTLAAVLFASGSAVEGLLRLADPDPGPDAARRLQAITIGPATSAVARRHGFTVAAEAATRDVDGLVAATRQWRPPDLTRLC